MRRCQHWQDDLGEEARLGRFDLDLERMLGRQRFTIPSLAERVDDILLVGEPKLEKAVSLLLQIEKTVVEGAGAAGLAAVLDNPADCLRAGANSKNQGPPLAEPLRVWGLRPPG